MTNRQFFLTTFLVFVFCRILLEPSIYLFDDAFITFRYAKNLASGNGFIYNLNENFLGVTSPVWGLLISIFFFLPKSIFLIKILNINLSYFTIYFISKYLGFDRLKTLIFLSFVIVLPYTIRINLGGMEADLFMFLIVFILYYFKLDKIWIITLAFVTYFVRPEGILFILIISIFSLLKYKKKAIMPIFLGISILIFGLILIKYNYGSFLPQSVLAKRGLTKPLLEVLSSFFYPHTAHLILIPLSLIGIWIKFKNRSFTLFHLFGFLYLLSYLIKSQMVWTWYIYPLLLWQIELSSTALSYFIKIKINLKNLIIVSFLLMIISFGISFSLQPNLTNKNIYEPIIEYSKIFDSKTTIFADDIGIIGFASNAHIYDSESLINDIAQKHDNKLDVIKYEKPDYIFVNLKKNVHDYFTQNQIYINYRVIKRFSKEFPDDILIKESELENSWSQDYYLFKKIKQ